MNIDEKLKITFKQLGKHIQTIRIEKEMTIKELSEKTGIRKEYLKKIEDGLAFGVLIDRHLLKIAKVLKIGIYELFNFE